ncbi:chorismate mutase [Nonomuraea sp. 3N208]|uniref:chorismate mutase n=1 Tax=Nonomuraea sp. 3N208 TaxID=3457421 RepID=UPI003FCDA905
MSSTLERHAVAVGDLLVGEGPAVVIGSRVSLRAHGGRADAYEVLRDRATLAEPYSAADLPAIAELADAVVVGASWTRDIPLVRAVAGLGLPVVVERRASAPVEEWLGLADYCAGEGDGRVILCEGGLPDHAQRGRSDHAKGGRPDLGLMRAARMISGRPVLADVSGDIGLSAAAVAAGADGLIVESAGPESAADPLTALRVAEEAVTVVGALLRPEAPATLPECRAAIDRVDAALATLLEHRAALAGIVQRIKPVGGFAGRDMARERALVARMALRAPSLGEARLAPIMNAVIEAGLHLAEERAAP